MMKKYVNAKEILPPALIEELQKYLDGAHLYVPRKTRKSWGTESGTREQLDRRNMEIQSLYRQNGLEVEWGLDI